MEKKDIYTVVETFVQNGGFDMDVIGVFDSLEKAKEAMQREKRINLDLPYWVDGKVKLEEEDKFVKGKLVGENSYFTIKIVNKALK